jgi:hypothetical protein
MPHASMTTREQNLRELPKGELVHKILAAGQRRLAAVKRDKKLYKRMGLVALQGVVAGIAGGVAGGLEIKMPTLGKTPIRTDLLLATAISGMNMIDVFEEGTPLAQSASDALTGHGVGRMAEKFLRQRGF